jgi:hypothetical protein
LYNPQHKDAFSKSEVDSPVDVKAIMGKGTWAYLNIYAAQLPEGPLDDQTINVITTILSNYPCLVCKTHAQQYLQDFPLKGTVMTTSDVQRWVYDFHQNVNARLKKPVYSFVQFSEEWLIPYKNCGDCQ